MTMFSFFRAFYNIHKFVKAGGMKDGENVYGKGWLPDHYNAGGNGPSQGGGNLGKMGPKETQ